MRIWLYSLDAVGETTATWYLVVAVCVAMLTCVMPLTCWLHFFISLRIHVAAAGYPLEGDPLYGPGGTPITHQLGESGHRVLRLPRDCGYLLHSACISFDHPSEDVGTRVSLFKPARVWVPKRAAVQRGMLKPRRGDPLRIAAQSLVDDQELHFRSKITHSYKSQCRSPWGQLQH
eukprot:COSAG03_NODE_83_length_13818_cov_11.329543_6_plen_175_part_00